MNTNFTFLKEKFSKIYEEIVEAEHPTFTTPRYAALLCRSTLEKALFWLYQNDEELAFPFDTKWCTPQLILCYKRKKMIISTRAKTTQVRKL